MLFIIRFLGWTMKAQRFTYNFSLSPVSMSSSSFATNQSAVPISAGSIDSNCGGTGYADEVGEVDVIIEKYPFQCNQITVLIESTNTTKILLVACVH